MILRLRTPPLGEDITIAHIQHAAHMQLLVGRKMVAQSLRSCSTGAFGPVATVPLDLAERGKLMLEA